jgi:hypothetical protein
MIAFPQSITIQLMNGVEGFGHRLDRDVSDPGPVFPNVIDDLVIGVIQLVLIQLHSFLKPHEKNPRIPLGRPRPAWSIRGFVVSFVYCNQPPRTGRKNVPADASRHGRCPRRLTPRRGMRPAPVRAKKSGAGQGHPLPLYHIPSWRGASPSKVSPIMSISSLALGAASPWELLLKRMVTCLASRFIASMRGIHSASSSRE